jgi:type IV pilus assembly protein PilA
LLTAFKAGEWFVTKNDEGFSLIELLIVVIIIAIIAAIAIPSLLRARISANESATIGDIRTVISGDHAYASANAGLFAHAMTCMVAPSNTACIPSYPAAAPTFLDSQIAGQLVKSGYNRSYVPGAAPAQVPPQANPASVVSFVYIATPAEVGRTGVRGFGTDASGVICVTPTGTAPATSGTIEITTSACIALQ